MKAYIDRHRDDYGVEPICRALQMAPSCYWRHAARQRNAQLRSARAQRDEGLKADIQRVWHANWQVYGADKVWLQMNREGIVVARCTVERLMRAMGLQGARRGRALGHHWRTTLWKELAALRKACGVWHRERCLVIEVTTGKRWQRNRQCQRQDKRGSTSRNIHRVSGIKGALI